MDPGDALVEVRGGQTVSGLQAQIVGQEREVVLVAGAQDDGVDLLRSAVGEVCGFFVHPLELGHFLPRQR